VFDWDGTDEAVSFYGELNTGTYGITADVNKDMFSISPPAGYGVTATLQWNHSAPGSFVYAESYGFLLSIGGTGHTSYSTYSGGAWAYTYYSNYGELSIGSDGTQSGRGIVVGNADGTRDGALEGNDDGMVEGKLEGIQVGTLEGSALGELVGSADGSMVGHELGRQVGM
jgi:hypothetical protein